MKTGLSIKQLGEREYFRQYRALKSPPALIQPRWTGISFKQLGSAAYNRIYRQKLKQLNKKD